MATPTLDHGTPPHPWVFVSPAHGAYGASKKNATRRWRFRYLKLLTELALTVAHGTTTSRGRVFRHEMR